MVAGGGRMGASQQGLDCTWTWSGFCLRLPWRGPGGAQLQRPRAHLPSPSPGPTSSTFRRPQTV